MKKLFLLILVLFVSNHAYAGSKTVTVNTKYWLSSYEGLVEVETVSGKPLYSNTLKGDETDSFTYSWSGISAENITVFVNDCDGVEYGMTTSDQEISPPYEDCSYRKKSSKSTLFNSRSSTKTSAQIVFDDSQGRSLSRADRLLYSGACQAGSVINKIQARIQYGFGIIDVKFYCHNGTNASGAGEWVTKNPEKDETQTLDCGRNGYLSEIAVKGEVKEFNDFFGAINIRGKCVDRSTRGISEKELRDNPSHPTAWAPYAQCPGNKELSQVIVAEEYGSGVIGFELLCRAPTN